MQERTYGHGDTSYQAANGEEGIRRLVDSFYDLMGTDDRFAVIYAMHPPDQVTTRDKLASFLCGWLGGPKLYNERYGSVAIPSVHAHLPITDQERDQWLTCMTEAVAEQPFDASFKRYLMEQLKVPANAVHRRCTATRSSA